MESEGDEVGLPIHRISASIATMMDNDDSSDKRH